MVGLKNIIPAGLAVTEQWGDGEPDELFQAEADALGRVAVKRQRDFARGRMCARRALTLIGVEPQPILRGAMRQPLWPTGVIGSITHCDGYSAAMVGRQAGHLSVGIDAERRRPLADGVLRMVASDVEVQAIAAAADGHPWELILFSAKESIFKAWYPLAGTWLGFDEATLEFDRDAERFVARLHPKIRPNCAMPNKISGRFAFDENHVFTCAVV